MPEEVKQEITNAVLAEQIKGLTKITDERFSSIKESLGRIEQHNLGFATKIELEETKKDFTDSIKRIQEGFAQHNLDDKESFGGLASGQKEVRDTLLKWGAIFGAILTVLSFLSPVLLKYLGWG